MTSNVIKKTNIKLHFYDFQIEGLKNPKGVAVDWVTKTVYYIDAGTSTISAVTTNGKKRVTLIGTGLGHPFDIVVDPASG